MPILQAFGPSAGTAPVPHPERGREAAARRHGVLPIPPLECNDRVAPATAPPYPPTPNGVPPAARRVVACVTCRAGSKAGVRGCCGAWNARGGGERLGDRGGSPLRGEHLANCAGAGSRVRDSAGPGGCEGNGRPSAEGLRRCRGGGP